MRKKYVIYEKNLFTVLVMTILLQVILPSCPKPLTVKSGVFTASDRVGLEQASKYMQFPAISRYDYMVELAGKGEYEKAKYFFSKNWLKKHIQESSDFAQIVTNDKNLHKSRIRRFTAGYDWAELILEYGDTLRKIYMVDIGGGTLSTSRWVIATEAEFEEAQKSSFPEETLFGIYLAFTMRDIEDVMNYFTPHTQELVTGQYLRQLYSFLFNGVVKDWREGNKWQMYELAIISKQNGETSGKVLATMQIYFVERGGKWLLASEDEFEATVEMFGDE